MSQPIRIGISIGDINGIGPEIVLKTLADPQVCSDLVPIVFASEGLLRFYARRCSITSVDFHSIADPAAAEKGRCNVIDAWYDEPIIDPGHPSEQSGKAAFRSLEAATTALIDGDVDVMVTAPIDKHNIQSAEFSFPGHTEYLASKSGQEKVLMFLVSDDLRIGVCTGHIPLSMVRDHLNEEVVLQKLRMMDQSLRQDFSIHSPRIAVLGLNPHAGDNGLIGTDEQDLVRPAMDIANTEGLDVFGPFPADGLFGSGAFKAYDAVLAMYHDQGLIPFKMHAFEQGVNFTAGLPILRTSPDHGTAFDIAGQGVASPLSFKEAMKKAVRIHKSRKSIID